MNKHSTSDEPKSRGGGRLSRIRWARFLWPTAIVSLLAVLMLVSSYPSSMAELQEEEVKEDPPPGMPVEAAVVSMAAVRHEISAVGTLNADESVVLTSEVAGRVTEIIFKEGEFVRAGKILLRLDASIQSAERDRAEASRALAEANYRRADQLLKANAVSRRERDEAYAQWRLEEANLRLAEAQLAKTVIRAPFSGNVGLRNVSAGGYLRPGDPIVTLSAVDPVKLDFRIPEGFSGKLRSGQTLRVAVDAAPGRTFQGSVYAIDPQLDAGGRSVLLRARIDNVERVLSPGMFARVTLVLEERPEALLIPEEALLAQGGGQMVYKVVDGVVEAAPVVTGQRQKGKVEIVQGVAEGETVITAGHLKVRPGMPVTVLPPPADPLQATKVGG